MNTTAAAIKKSPRKKNFKSTPYSASPTSSASSVNYTLAVKNNSGQDNMVCVYDGNTQISADMVKLAWLVEPAGAGDTLEFQWTLDYEVFWKKTNEDLLNPYPANPQQGSSFILEGVDSQFQLNAETNNGASGAIYINTADNIGVGAVSTGVTLTGSPIVMVDAIPNKNYTFTFSPAPTYYLAFGDYTEGQKLDTSSEANTKVEFQTGVYELYFVIGQDYKFTQVTESAFSGN